MENNNQLKSGVFLSYINLAVGMLIPIFYTPVMLRMLGQAEYGLYALANSVIAYLSLLSFGFGTTIIRYISKYRAEGNQIELEKVFGFFLKLYMGIAIAVMACGIGIAFNLEPIFGRGLTTEETAKMKVLVLVMAVHSALAFPVSVYSSMIVAHERFIFRRVIDILSSVAAPVANLIVLYLGFASIGMAVASTIVEIIIVPANIIYCQKTLRIRPRFERIPQSLVKEMIGVSAFHFLGSIVDMLFWATDKVILGMLASTVAVAVYNVGGTFNNMVMSLTQCISGVMVPRVTMMVFQKESEPNQLTDVFIKIGRIQFLIIGLIVSGFSVFGQEFINMWAGDDYANSFWVAVLTMYPLCIPLMQNIGVSIISAQNKHQFRSVVYLIVAIINVITTYILVPRYGVIAAAMCSCGAYLLGHGVIMNLYYYKVTQIDIPMFWRNIGSMAVVPACMTFAGLYVKKVIPIDNWLVFFAGVGIFATVYAVLMLRFALNEYEKKLLIEPLIKIARKKVI